MGGERELNKEKLLHDILSIMLHKKPEYRQAKKNSYTCLPLSAMHYYYMLSYLIATTGITLRNVKTFQLKIFQGFNMIYIIIGHF